MNRAFPYLSPNGDETGAGADHTDNSGLLTGPTFYVNPDGSMAGEAFPRPQIEDDSCIGVATCGQVGNIQTFDFPQDAGTDAGIISPRPFILPNY